MTEKEFRYVDAKPHMFEISIVVRDLEKAVEKFKTLFGWEPYVTGDFSGERATEGDFFLRGERVPAPEVKVACFRTETIRIELLQPIAEKTLYMEFLREKGPGVQHVGFRVSDIEKELAEIQKRGSKVTQRMTTEGISYAYIDTEDLIGTAFEVVQSPGGIPLG